MSVKSWVLDRVQGVGAAVGRPDLPGRPGAFLRDPELDAESSGRAEAGLFAPPSLAEVEQLGAYAPLIGAIREELEHFVAGHVRLHVVIADRDRYVLTALGVRSPGGDAAHERLCAFMREFRPEQVKRYLAREVIGRLPNAAVIDLAQFAGLSDLDARERGGDDDAYGELVAALRIAPPAAPERLYEISIFGRWVEAEPPSAAAAARRGAATPATPLAGRRCEFEIDDSEGPRRAAIHAVVPGRRYVVGKGEECDLRVSGTYTSRRHAELWFERGSWHLGDAGSTNGVRAELSPGVDAATARIAAGSTQSITLAAGAIVVLSARAEGPPADYPRLAIRADGEGERTHAADATSVAAGAVAAVAAAPATASTGDMPVPGRVTPSTPRTAIYSARASEPVFEVGEVRAEGVHVHAVRQSELPITIGRSRSQSIVIDWRHESVSGHHLDIASIEADLAHGVVRGDNGVSIDGTRHAAGERFSWRIGQKMTLGSDGPGEVPCMLTLARRAEA